MARGSWAHWRFFRALLGIFCCARASACTRCPHAPPHPDGRRRRREDHLHVRVHVLRQRHATTAPLRRPSTPHCQGPSRRAAATAAAVLRRLRVRSCQGREWGIAQDGRGTPSGTRPPSAVTPAAVAEVARHVRRDGRCTPQSRARGRRFTYHQRHGRCCCCCCCCDCCDCSSCFSS